MSRLTDFLQQGALDRANRAADDAWMDERLSTLSTDQMPSQPREGDRVVVLTDHGWQPAVIAIVVQNPRFLCLGDVWLRMDAPDRFGRRDQRRSQWGNTAGCWRFDAPTPAREKIP